MPTRKYIYYDFTISLCTKCLKRIPAKIIFQDECVYMVKQCQTHGSEKVLIATDIEYYKRCRDFLKPGDMPHKFNTKTHFGCPYDCGLCPDHEQHSCLTILEVTDRCNLSCPTCYANSSPTYGRHRTLDEIEMMLDRIVENEHQPDVVQISGGEPTIHPDFFKILDLAKSRPIRHLMLNTNGIKIAKDKKFVERLASYQPGFEIYLQFDSFKPSALQSIRGKDLTSVRQKALENLNAFDISTTLVATLQKGLNDNEIGAIINFAAEQPCVRGVTLQPTQLAGRLDNFDPKKDCYTLTEARSAILSQSNIFNANDLIPVPCNPDALMMGYALKIDNQLVPLTRMIDPQKLLEQSDNTIVYENNETLKSHLIKLFSTGNSDKTSIENLQSLMCCLPKIDAPNLSYKNLFRVIVMQFMDASNFDVRAVKRSCVHIVNKNGQLIPFETMNIFYRDEKQKILDKVRKESQYG